MTISHTVYFSDVDNNNPDSSKEEQIGEVYIGNISPKERKKRVQFAVQQLAITLFVLAALVVSDVDLFWRLLLFFMFSAATTSYIQALDKT